MKTAFDSVLLLAFGGPERPEDVLPFLDNVSRGRNIPKARLDLVTQQYKQIGGASPFNQLTQRQRAALELTLKTGGTPLPVYLGYRHCSPYIKEVLATVVAAGCKKTVAIVLSPFQSPASWDVYLKEIPNVPCIPPWGLHPLYVETMAERLNACPNYHTIFTTHSIPVEMSRGSPYASQFQETARLIMKKLGHPPPSPLPSREGVGGGGYSIAFQSRSGRPEDKWLEPDIRDEIRRLSALGIKKITVAPIGFVADHAEILYDLDILAAETAREVGVDMQRAQAAGDHPLFIKMLATLVQNHAA